MSEKAFLGAMELSRLQKSITDRKQSLVAGKRSKALAAERARPMSAAEAQAKVDRILARSGVSRQKRVVVSLAGRIVRN